MKNLGIVIVTYNSADVIRDCLETLCSGSSGARIIVVDNASTDETVNLVEDWSTGKDGFVSTGLPFHVEPVAKPINAASFKLLKSPQNGGFAAGVNQGIKHCLNDPMIDRVWVVNPDTLTPCETPKAIAKASSDFGLMGGRILYARAPFPIQIDGGSIAKWTGVTGNLGLGATSDMPPSKAEEIDFISGASMVASRTFIEAVGPMSEDYFLYYEEVDWALRRGDLPLRYCEGAVVYHHAGTAIGSPTLQSPPSPMSAYYKHRARMIFLRRHFPISVPTGYLYGIAKAAQAAIGANPALAMAILRALFGLKLSSR